MNTRAHAIRAMSCVGFAIVFALTAACGASTNTTSSTTSPTPDSTSVGHVITTTSTVVTRTTVNVIVSDSLTDKMALTTDRAAVPAGDVTFVVRNAGPYAHHEVVVLKTDVPFDQLPITTFEGEPDRVAESDRVGETGDPSLKPGETRTFTVKNMTAGKYVLVCNIAGHYRLGMRAAFTVSNNANG